jgi:hypothetical protein
MHLLGEDEPHELEGRSEREPAPDDDLRQRLERVEERLAELERALAPRDPDEGHL